jgi:hypothetical protein
MAQAELDNYLIYQEVNAQSFRKLVLNSLFFKFFLLRKLPMALLAGLRIRTLNDNMCEVSVPFRWLNQNPFRSTYFAVLSMAAEMSTGLAVLMYTHSSKLKVSTLVVKVEGDFFRKASGKTTFKFEDVSLVRKAVEKSFLTGEPQSIVCRTSGFSEDGVPESEFRIVWSVKAKI